MSWTMATTVSVRSVRVSMKWPELIVNLVRSFSINPISAGINYSRRHNIRPLTSDFYFFSRSPQ